MSYPPVSSRFNEKEPQSVIRQLAAIANTLYLVSVEVDKFDHKGTMAPPSPKNDYVYFVELRNFIGIATQNLNSRLYQYSSEYSAYVRYIIRNHGRDKILYNISFGAALVIYHITRYVTFFAAEKGSHQQPDIFLGGPQARLMQGRQVNTFALPEARGRIDHGSTLNRRRPTTFTNSSRDCLLPKVGHIP